jgi:2-polyprenyl-3-methyl-5-hydroxy-6-metoxy-1,4-benzoquinol methylase
MWDERYSEEGYAFGDQPNDFLAEQAGALRPGNCLCVAEGQGRNAVFLAGQGLEVTAMDMSAVGLERAQELAASRGVTIHTEVGDLADYDLGREKWDNIVSIFVHMVPAMRRDVHRRVAAALKPGGLVLLEAYTPGNLEIADRRGGPGPEMPERFMTLAALEEDFAGLEFLVAREVRREVNEGTYHQGESAVVQLLARKPTGD